MGWRRGELEDGKLRSLKEKKSTDMRKIMGKRTRNGELGKNVKVNEKGHKTRKMLRKGREMRVKGIELRKERRKGLMDCGREWEDQLGRGWGEVKGNEEGNGNRNEDEHEERA